MVVTDERVAPAEHKKFVAAEINKWGPVIKAAGAVRRLTRARGQALHEPPAGGFFVACK